MLECLGQWEEERKTGKGIRRMGLYVCGCGEHFAAERYNIKSGNTSRCQRCARESRSKKLTVHGMVGASKADGGKAYYTWRGMRGRCINPNNERYDDYGGRGITVCERWDCYENFIFDMGEPPTESHSIERIDNNKGYSPENCKWASRKEQANNKRNNRIILALGETLTLMQWSDKTGLKRETIARRLNSGWKPDDVVTLAEGKKPPRYRCSEGDFGTIKEIAELYGMSISGTHSRITSKSYPDWCKLF